MVKWNKFVPGRVQAGAGRVNVASKWITPEHALAKNPAFQLPVELWRRILAPLAQTPGYDACDFPDPFVNTSKAYNHDEFSPEERVEVLRLTEVCQTWREIILESMAQYIVVYRLDDLRAVVRRFEDSKKAAVKAGTNGLGLGRLTRRIDFRMHRKDPRESCWKVTIDTIIRLFELTPNLEIYVNSNGSNFNLPLRSNPRMMEALVRLHGSRLRRVEWNHAECPSWPDLATFLMGTPNLQALNLTTIYAIQHSVPEDRIITLKRLTHLSLGMPNTAIPHLPRSWGPMLSALSCHTDPYSIPGTGGGNDQLPAITHLAINPFPSPHFFVAHGRKLRSLRTNSRGVLPHLPDALGLCEYLHTLVIPPTPGLCILQNHPSIERIGIFPVRDTTIEVPARMFNIFIMLPLEETLLLVEGMTLPRLKAVRVKNMGAMKPVEDKSLTMQAWWRRWNIRGVRFEDTMGTSFEQVVTGM